MKNIILLIVLSLMAFSCGKSPFTNNDILESNHSGNFSLETELLLKKHNLYLHMYWSQGPLLFEESQLVLLVTDAKSKPVAIPGQLKVKLWMPDMGHGSSETLVKKLSEGVYHISDIFFIMGGIWDISFQVFNKGILDDETVFRIKL